jgi:hypothetical protein
MAAARWVTSARVPAALGLGGEREQSQRRESRGNQHQHLQFPSHGETPPK